MSSQWLWSAFSVEELKKIAAVHQINTSKMRKKSECAEALINKGVTFSADKNSLLALSKEELVKLLKVGSFPHSGNKPDLAARLVALVPHVQQVAATSAVAVQELTPILPPLQAQPMHAARCLPAVSETSLELSAKSVNAPRVEWWTESKTPFPPASCGGFTETSVGQMAVEAGGKMVWCGQEFTKQEWASKVSAWYASFPNVVKKSGYKGKKCTYHEIEDDSTKARSNSDNIQACFAMLPATNQTIGRKWNKIFRVDMYGNVVADPLLFSDSALCAFDVDHIFCWSRGGRSVRANFAAVQWDANRRVKRDELVQALNPAQMACGLAPEQFKALMEFAETRAGGSSNRRDVQHEQDRVKSWLTSGPRKGQALSNFRSIMPSFDGATLWAFFEKNETGCASREQQPRLVAAVPNSLVIPVAPIRQPQVHVRRLGGSADQIEVYGPNTFLIKEGLKALGLRWDNENGRKCWWSAEHIERLLTSIREICVSKGLEFDLILEAGPNPQNWSRVISVLQTKAT